MCFQPIPGEREQSQEQRKKQWTSLEEETAAQGKPIANCGSNDGETALLHSSDACERNREVTSGGTAESGDQVEQRHEKRSRADMI